MKKMNRLPIRTLSVWVLTAIIALHISGCANKKKSTASAMSYPASNQVTFSDLPVPYGFKLDRKQSYAFKDGESRIAMLKYIGRTKMDQVSGFYQNTMDAYGWQALKLIDFAKTMQQFGKSNEICTITIERGNKPLLGIIPYARTIITMQVTPNRVPLSESTSPVPYVPAVETAHQPEVTPVEQIPLSTLK